ncbi:type I phosphomannose isomerase catalytic subunit [Mycoplasma crocodyli]|uniref:Mannose-6-phosphate isomerase n=1 Tax=Mycoplasma crocodyli (strain ATCC 51981 / MP145) TaxID=512564 RepID=D5E667_MYCCM|nr:type I phosphomannose isomerase catalytic subunit [Mycoplasma crocodyli]ADE19375.1 mannose-6-phosphate isomerase [Mycoplasma crocodyli MP145]
MKKVIPVKHEKIWGYEIWLYSPLKEAPTQYEDKSGYVSRGPLIKIIKANDPLSIQVHPDNELAKELENQDNGKSESWLVLDCNEKSELVVGLNNHDQKVIEQALQNKTIDKYLKVIKPKIGQFIDIPAGLVHGIGRPNASGITVLEVQQPSDVTYRFWDYNRKDKNGNFRDLHVNKALKSIKDLNYKVKPSIENETLIYKTEYYKLHLLSDVKVAPSDGVAIINSNDEYFAEEILKDEKLNKDTVFFVEEI